MSTRQDVHALDLSCFVVILVIGSASHDIILGSDLCFSWSESTESLVGEKFDFTFPLARI